MIQKILKILELIKAVPIVDISQVVVIVCSMIFVLVKVFYKSWNKMEKSYYHNVPKEYFEKDAITVIEEYFVYIVAILVFIILLFFIEMKYKSNRTFIYVETLIISFIFLMVNMEITRKNRLNDMSKKANVVCKLIFVIWTILFTICVIFFQYGKHNFILYIIAIIIWVIIYSCYIEKSLLLNKYKYRDCCEFIKIKTKEYIVISNYKGKLVLQEIKQVDKKRNKIAINTNYFKVVELNGLEIYTKNNLIITNLIPRKDSKYVVAEQ